MSFIIPSIRTDYTDLSRLDHNAHEIHILDLRGMGDCILEAAAAGRSSGTAFSKNNGRLNKSILNTAGHPALPDLVRPVCGFINGISFAPALPGASAISAFLIISIHLKDGSK